MSQYTITGTLQNVAAWSEGGHVATLVHPEARLSLLIPDTCDRALVYNGAQVTVEFTEACADLTRTPVTAIREANR